MHAGHLYLARGRCRGGRAPAKAGRAGPALARYRLPACIYTFFFILSYILVYYPISSYMIQFYLTIRSTILHYLALLSNAPINGTLFVLSDSCARWHAQKSDHAARMA